MQSVMRFHAFYRVHLSLRSANDNDTYFMQKNDFTEKNDITQESAPLIKNKSLRYAERVFSKKDLHALLHPDSLRLDFFFATRLFRL